MEHLVLNFLNDSFQHDYPVERCKITVILFGSMLPNFIGLSGPSLFSLICSLLLKDLSFINLVFTVFIYM